MLMKVSKLAKIGFLSIEIPTKSTSFPGQSGSRKGFTVVELVKSQNGAFFERQRKKLRSQGARLPTTEAYFPYAAGRRDEGQRNLWTFSEAVRSDEFEKSKQRFFRTAKEKAPQPRRPIPDD
jgi:hypothetical protein